MGDAGVKRAHITQPEQEVNSRPLSSTDPICKRCKRRLSLITEIGMAQSHVPVKLHLQGRSLRGVMYVRTFEINLMSGRDLQISGDISRMSSSAALKAMSY